MGFPRQEGWDGLPFPPPGDLPDPGTEHASPASPALQAESLPLSHWGNPSFQMVPSICSNCVHGFVFTGVHSICKGVEANLNIQKTKIMASGPITSWEIDGETVSDFIFGGSKITADGDCSHEIKRHLCLGRKVMTNLDSIFKSIDITLPTKVHLVKAMVFPVIMYGCESWTVKKAEHQRIDAFELWCWRRLLRVPWTARQSNQSILKETSPGCSLEGLLLKLKLQYFGHLM